MVIFVEIIELIFHNLPVNNIRKGGMGSALNWPTF